MRTPPSGIAAWASVARTTLAPAAVEAGSATVAPSCFRIISATKLSESAGEAVEVGAVERRVAVADEEEVAAPRPSGAGPLADELRAEPEARPQYMQRGERDGELLGGCGQQAATVVLAEERLAGAEVD